MSDVTLGLVYRDVVTGFMGQAIGRAEYLYEGPQVLVAAESKQSASDSRWLPERRLELVAARKTGISMERLPTTGDLEAVLPRIARQIEGPE